MASIFEQLMRQNAELTESTLMSTRTQKNLDEVKKIKVSKIKVESRHIFEEEDLDELDTKFAVDQDNLDNDEVVLVIDPELPAEGEDEPEITAEEMIGDKVYKCPVCGANYLCDCEHAVEEGIDLDENGVPVECPICGDDAEQILIGEIAPAEDVNPEDEVTEEPVDIDDNQEESEDVDDDQEETEEVTEDLEIVADNAELQEDVEVEIEEEEEEEEDSDVCPECGHHPCRCPKNSDDCDYCFDERRFESMINNSVIKKNYTGNPRFKVEKITTCNNKLRFSYTVTEGEEVTKGTMIAEGFVPSQRSMKLKISDRGAFTESFTRKPAFIVECVKVKNIIVPTDLRYDYMTKVNESTYRVVGNYQKNSK